MTGYITGFDGGKYELPVLLSWDMSYGFGTPCDSFEVSFAYDKAMLSPLQSAVSFEAEHEGVRVFTGRVDEFEITAGENGFTAVLRGRSMAALLLDNEAVAAEYYPATLGIILENHVYPWGISKVRAGKFPAVQGFKVPSGQSQWGVIENFAWFGGGIRPWFDRDGVLRLDGECGSRLELDWKSAVCSQRYTEKRYGVISTATVVNKPLGITSTVENSDFLARGGACRRVVTVPKATCYDAMRHTGQYQIERSRDEERLNIIETPQLFAAFPGDVIELKDSPIGICGSFSVLRSRVYAGVDGGRTVITMKEI